MQVERLGHDKAFFSYWFEGQAIRKQVGMKELTEFLTGRVKQETNLGRKGEVIRFKDFAERYLSQNARTRMKESSFLREAAIVKALNRYCGEKALHEISLEDWDSYKCKRLTGALSGRGKSCAEGTVKKEFKCWRAILSYAADLGFVRWNVLTGVKPGLCDGNRADIWLTKEEIESYLAEVPEHLRDLFEFRIWTGARPKEAGQFGKANINWDTGELWINIVKKKKNATGPRKRYFEIRSLGPRFEALLKRLVAHPETGLYFANRKTGTPYSARYLVRVFDEAIQAAGIVKRIKVVSYDLRGTFAMHRAMVIRDFFRLKNEMGHLDSTSIQHYVDEAGHFKPEQSIFFGIEGLSGGGTGNGRSA